MNRLFLGFAVLLFLDNNVWLATHTSTTTMRSGKNALLKTRFTKTLAAQGTGNASSDRETRRSSLGEPGRPPRSLNAHRRILEAIRRAFPCPRLRVADRGLREGMLVEMMRADGVWGEA